MGKIVGFYRDKDKKVRPITEKTKGSRYHGQTGPSSWGSSSLHDVKQAHAQRSVQARRTDEALRAPIAKTPQEWKHSPNRTDVKDVDYPRGPVVTRKQMKQMHETKADYDRTEKKAIEEYRSHIITGEPQKKWTYYVMWRNTEGQVGVSTTKASSKTEAYENAKKWPMFKETIEAQHESEYHGFMKPPPASKQESRVDGVGSYNTATGWMRVTFDAKPDRATLDGLKARGFRYQPRSRAWSAKWTPEREDHAKTLVKDWEEVDIKPDWARKAEHAAELSAKHLKEADRRHDAADRISSVIPLGQPILVGHHSEKRHRRDLERIRKNLGKAVEEREVAEKYAERAKRYGRKATGESPGLIYRRIEKLEVEERKHKRNIQEIKKDPENYFLWIKKHDSETKKRKIKAATEREQRWLKHTQSRLEIEREKYKASGGIATDKMKVKPGDKVRTRWGVGTVKKVSKKTVRVLLPGEFQIYGNRETGSKLSKDDIYGKVT